MFQPVNTFDVGVACYFVTPDAVLALQFVEPCRNTLRSIVVVGVEKAREHSRISASPPLIVENGPEEDEAKPSFA
jgi:hypothetical protein